MEWDEYFLGIARAVSLKSKDRSVQVGAVVVGHDHEIRSTGFNGFPRWVRDDIEERHERPAKYIFTVHAEENSVLNAARIGTPLKGCSLYLNFIPPPCNQCTRAIIQAGIIEVIGPPDIFPGVGKGVHYHTDGVVLEMLAEADVDLYVYTGTGREILSDYLKFM
jgi:dCMP deaminase